MGVVLLAVVVGFVAVRLAWLLLRHTLDAEVFRRTNYRGRSLPTAGGLAIAAGCLMVEAGRAVAVAAGVGETTVLSGARVLVLLGVVGFSLLGLADDLGAVGEARGFRGHLRALAGGHLTTGGLKLFGGGFFALILAGSAEQANGRGLVPTGFAAVIRLFVDAGVIALAANLANLLDRAPGRTIKFSMVAFAALLAAVAIGDRQRLGLLGGAALVVGGGLGVLPTDLRERVMLGDTGANALGATLGLSVVLTLSPTCRIVALMVLGALNVASELVSFSQFIHAVAPLRAFDLWGRQRQGHSVAARAGTAGKRPSE
jgi:UDP-GlcNAc:undecaprenyl-phosphate/decaprenyl-phosphate GlcNAc-1-phosphate transferase